MADKTPTISVIMPVYNCAEYVKKAIDSIMAQSFTDFELIIVDDGSTDDTWGAVSEHPLFCGRIFGVNHGGAAKALNYGLSLAKGEYIARHDGDDWSHPLRFERQIEYLENNPGCNVVGTGMVLVDGDTIPFENLVHPPVVNKDYLLNRWPCVAHPTVMIRADVFKDVGMYDESIDYCEDYDLWLRIVERCGDDSIHNIPEMLYVKREHSLTNTAKGKKNGLITLYNEMVILKSKIRGIKKDGM